MIDDIYPSLSIGSTEDGKIIGTSSTISKGKSQKIINFDTKKIISSILQISLFSSYIGIGFLSVAALNILLRKNSGYVIDNLLGLKDIKEQNQILLSENEQIKQLKIDQDEIWNAILNIHNTQNDLKASTESTVVSIDAIQTSINKLESSIKKSIDEILSHFEDIEKGLANNNEDILDKIRDLQSRWDDELSSVKSNISGIKQELPNILQGHDKLVTDKLQKFKENLKEIIITSQTTSSISKSANKQKQK